MTSRVGVARKGLEQNSVFEIRVVSAGQVCSCLPRPALHLAPSVGEQCKQCKQCKEGHGRVVERSATPGTSSEIPLRSPTHTQQLQQHTGRCFNGAQGHDTAATNIRWIATPCLAHLSFWRFIPLAHESANFTATGTHICRMGLQNDLRDTRGANLF